MTLLRPPHRDLTLAVAFAFAACAEAWLADRALSAVLAVTVASVALGWVRVAPVAVAATVLLSFAVSPTGSTTVLSVVPFLVSMGFTGRRAPLWPAIGVAIGAALVLGLTDVEETSSLSQVAANVSYYLLLSAVLVAVGQLLQFAERREHVLVGVARTLNEEGAERERAAIAAERTRMSRELHDVVAHALTVVGIHAAVARTTLTDDPARAGKAIERIEQAAEQASEEMRRLLGLLRETVDGPPLPRLVELPALVEESRRVHTVTAALEGVWFHRSERDGGR